MEYKVKNDELIDIKLEVADEEMLPKGMYETEKVFVKEERLELEEPSVQFLETSQLDELTDAKDVCYFQCRYCSNSFNTKENLIAHEKANHPKPKKFKVRYCKFCTARLSDPSLVELHRVQHAKTKARLNCKMCDKVFKSRESLDMHLSTVHQVNNAYKCQECFKSFRLKSLLKFHKQSVHVPTQVVKY